MNSNEENTNNITSGTNVTVNMNNNPINITQSSNTNINMSTNVLQNNGQSYSQPVVEEKPKKKNNIILIIGIIAILCVVGYFIYNKFISNQNDCIELKNEGSMSFDNQLAIQSGDTQYVFSSKFDIDFISTAIKFDNIKLNVCSTSQDNSSINFHVGDTTNTRMVESYELIDSDTGKKINANNTNELLKELGYHSYGTYKEEATVIETDDYGTFGYISGMGCRIYDIELQLSSGKKVIAKYTVYDKQINKNELLKKNQKYTFDFEVKEETFEPIVYIIKDFN